MIGLYCIDVSAAFDRVSRERLCEKILASGLPDDVVAFLCSWLEDRTSNVIVGGECSDNRVLANSVFQGTVLGSPLWNLFYADARHAVRELGFVETVFADDFNCWKGFDWNVDGPSAIESMKECQVKLHDWGAANQVVFDPSKESFAILRARDPVGEDFKLLGIIFDTKLLMHKGARKVATDAGWRLRAILRVRRYFTTPELVRLYKSLVLSFVESGLAGYFHAATSVLECVDRVQRRFLREIGMSETIALLNFNLAPLRTRRDMAILGMLHRVNLGETSEQMRELFRPTGVRLIGDTIGSRTRAATAFHTKQLLDRVTRSSSDMFKRSAFGMVQCYNALPQRVVDEKSVKSFQRALQNSLKLRASEGFGGWQDIFSVGQRYASVLRFQAFFQA